jgi:hypothetical protein
MLRSKLAEVEAIPAPSETMALAAQAALVTEYARRFVVIAREAAATHTART